MTDVSSLAHYNYKLDIINFPSARLSDAFRRWNCCYETAISTSIWETMSVSGKGLAVQGIFQGA